MKINVFVNGNEIKVAANQASVFGALQVFLTADQQEQSFAAALNGEFIGKDSYAATNIKEGDSLDVLFPIQGG